LRVSFFGAAAEVGRSCIMLESGDSRILLDAGVKIGNEKEEYPLIGDDDLGSIDGIFLSHAHLDHSAYLPHIYSEGYQNKTYATKPTSELVNILVNDYLKISEPDNVSKDCMQGLQKHIAIAEYGSKIKVKDFTVRFLHAGHILGSAMVEVSDGKETAIYTGDVNFRKTRLLDGAQTEGIRANTLITESTYGGDADIFPPEKVTLGAMTASIKETLDSGGKVLLPSFGVGRAQEILLILDDYMKSGALPEVPIYTDGMVNKAMRIHRHNVIYCREELQRRILMNDDDPFKSKNFVAVDTTQQRRKIISENTSGIVVATSGMLTGGPILKYLERLSGTEGNKIIFVGYQADGTRGREMIEGAKKISIGNRSVEIKLSVEQYRLSAHADRSQLSSFVSKIEDLEKIFVVHGEEAKSHEFAKSLSGKYSAIVPRLKSEHSV
jgi:predicted metal-dependent RNase